ncbi:hypothetical protein VUR80DRAFT_9939 [Thermomyces stellatus]
MFAIVFVRLAFLLLIFYIVLYPLYVYLKDPKKLKKYPGPPIASVTDAWGVLHQYFHTRTAAVHQAHLKYGRVVRVGTKHLSFASVEAIRDIYGHGTPVTKDNFYRASMSTHLNVSDAQEKSIHNIKRKRFAAAFAQKRIVHTEDVVAGLLGRVVALLDSKLGTEVDMKKVMLHLMYNYISITMYAQDPRFIENESTVTTAETPQGELYETDMYQSMIHSARVNTSVGWAPASIKMIKFLTQWHPGWTRGQGLRDVTIHLVRNRLRMDQEAIRRGEKPLDDLFTTMLFDRNGEPLGLELGELVSEAANMFNAAGENTEIAITNAIWLLSKHPDVVTKLRRELDGVFDYKTTAVPRYDAVKDLPYLRACIDESLRLRPSIEGGLPRRIPEPGMAVAGEWLQGGLTVSVSTRTIHRDPTVFGDRPEEYIPERWLRPNASSMQRGFLAFSQGGRACIGRNIAYFEMTLTIATLFARYDFSLPSPDWELGIDENFSAHTRALPVKVERRK